MLFIETFFCLVIVSIEMRRRVHTVKAGQQTAHVKDVPFVAVIRPPSVMTIIYLLQGPVFVSAFPPSFFHLRGGLTTLRVYPNCSLSRVFF